MKTSIFPWNWLLIFIDHSSLETSRFYSFVFARSENEMKVWNTEEPGPPPDKGSHCWMKCTNNQILHVLHSCNVNYHLCNQYNWCAHQWACSFFPRCQVLAHKENFNWKTNKGNLRDLFKTSINFQKVFAQANSYQCS